MKTKLLILAIAVIAMAGCNDYEAEVAEAKHYCDMVKQGSWPDYKNQAEYCPEVFTL